MKEMSGKNKRHDVIKCKSKLKKYKEKNEVDNTSLKRFARPHCI